MSLEDGFCMDEHRDTLPAIAGIYVVYSCDYDSDANEVVFKDILYIGETKNIHERHNGTPDKPKLHEHYNDFVKEAGGKNHVCYRVIPYNGSGDDREWLQYALIHVQQPPINTVGKDHYNFPAAEVKLEGDPACWKKTHFSHPLDYGDEIEDKDLMKRLGK